MWRRSAEYCEEKPGIARGRYESCRSCRCLFQDARSFAKSGFSSSSFGMVVVVWLPRCRFRFSHQNADDRRWDCGIYIFVTGEMVFPLWALIILLLLSVCSSRCDVFGNQKSGDFGVHLRPPWPTPTSSLPVGTSLPGIENRHRPPIGTRYFFQYTTGRESLNGSRSRENTSIPSTLQDEPSAIYASSMHRTEKQ